MAGHACRSEAPLLPTPPSLRDEETQALDPWRRRSDHRQKSPDRSEAQQGAWSLRAGDPASPLSSPAITWRTKDEYAMMPSHGPPTRARGKSFHRVTAQRTPQQSRASERPERRGFLSRCVPRMCGGAEAGAKAIQRLVTAWKILRRWDWR